MSTITQADRTRLKEWFSEKCESHSCRACNRSDWTISDFLLGAFNAGGGGNVNLANIEPIFFVALSCRNCGLTEFFSAGIIGIAVNK